MKNLEKNVVIMNVDGTLAHKEDPSVDVLNYKPNLLVLQQARTFIRRPDTHLSIITSRGDDLRMKTMQWCNQYLNYTTEAVNPVVFYTAKPSDTDIRLFKQRTVIRAARKVSARPVFIECFENDEEILKMYNAVLRPKCRVLRLHLTDRNGYAIWDF